MYHAYDDYTFKKPFGLHGLYNNMKSKIKSLHSPNDICNVHVCLVSIAKPNKPA